MSQSVAELLREIEERSESVLEEELVSRDATIMRTITHLTEARDEIDERLRIAVAEARRQDFSWARIGLCLNVSKQAAQKKYGAKTST